MAAASSAAAPRSARRRAVLGPLCLAAALSGTALVGAEVSREQQELDEFNRQQGSGLIKGTTGEYFRYKHMPNEAPEDEDREEAMAIGGKIRCDVCVAILESLVKRAPSLSEDDLADAIEGNAELEMTGDLAEDSMRKHKKGCNKHFKDELVAEGWTLRSCKEVHPAERPDDDGPCLFRDPASKPSQMAIDSYELWKECLFYACERTVSRYGDSLAEHLPSALRKAENKTEVIQKACRKVARCDKGKPSPKAEKGQKWKVAMADIGDEEAAKLAEHTEL